MDIRPLEEADLPALRAVLDGIELFPSDMLADMAAGFLSGAGKDLWLTCVADGAPCGFAYAVPEALTDGTWNLLAIGIAPARQGAGLGSALMRGAEEALRGRGARLLIVDTSGTEGFGQARGFYRGLGYDEEARIRDFWAAGDDKVTFRKAL